jgi:hypothetical protein
MNTINSEEYPILNQCLEDTYAMLKRYWGDIARVRDASDKLAAVTISFKIDCSGESPIVKTRLGFSRRYRDVCETVVDLGQTNLPFLKNLE